MSIAIFRVIGCKFTHYPSNRHRFLHLDAHFFAFVTPCAHFVTHSPQFVKMLTMPTRYLADYS